MAPWFHAISTWMHVKVRTVITYNAFVKLKQKKNVDGLWVVGRQFYQLRIDNSSAKQ